MRTKRTLRVALALSLVALFIVFHFTATTPRPAYAQDVKATVSPLPTPIPVNGQWLFLGGGNSIQGECVTGYEPQFFSDGVQWQVICLYGSN
jgi:hypothetical protein